MSELAQQYDVHPNQITTWKNHLLDGAAGVFGGEQGEPAHAPVDLQALHAKIGQLTLENDFLAGALGKAGLLRACLGTRWLRAGERFSGVRQEPIAVDAGSIGENWRRSGAGKDPPDRPVRVSKQALSAKR